MKIGILTFHRCINYGSYWQARFLVEEMLNRGHDAVILDHYSKKVNLAEWRCAMQPVLPTPVPKTDFAFYKEKVRKFFDAVNSLPLSPCFSLENPSTMDVYDIIIVGSDEVWNLSHPWYGYYPIFFGEGLNCRKLISYAASFGNYNSEWKPDPEWINKLRKFASISIRDENSGKIIKNSLGIEPELVLDPCLQFATFSKKNNESNEGGEFAAVYGHNFSASFINKIKKWAYKRKLPLLSIGYRNEWADEQWLTADPIEFKSFIAQSEAVITNFYHGCIFAILNDKPFICETSPYRSNKILDLMNKINGEKHIITESTPTNTVNSLLTNPPDDEIKRKIGDMRKISNTFMDKALKIEQQ